jgi:uncharacterized protein (DUF697 family)
MTSAKRIDKNAPAPPEEGSAAQPAPSEGAVPSSKALAADGIIRKYIGWSCAGGLLPVPLLDIAAITATQIQMVRELSALYGVPFQDHKGRSIIASLLGGVGAAAAGRGVFCSVLKAVPVIGTIGGLISVPIVAGSGTYALGKVFVEHFEQGGTLLDFDPAPMRGYFEDRLKEGQKVAREVWKKASARSSR